MLTIHIGPHKTGSTFIQRRMTQNRHLFGRDYQTLVKVDLPVLSLIDAIYPLQTQAAALKAVDTIRERAFLLGKLVADTQNTLASSEDLLGPLPTRCGIVGVYPFAEITLSAMVSGLEQAGTPYQFAFYLREYKDWLRSVYRYKFRDQPDRGFAPLQFAKRNGLPASWGGILACLQQAVPAENLRILSFEQDRATGNFGQALFDLSGLPREVQTRFKPLEPVNVSQTETVDPKHWQS